MRVVDLTLELYSGMSTVPTRLYATKPPRFEVIGVVDEKQKQVLSELGLTLAKDLQVGYLANVSRFELLAHGGTHIDAPRHFFADREGITDIDIHAFVKTGFALTYLTSDQENLLVHQI